MAESSARSSASLSDAGYENEFVDFVPFILCCPICLLPFRDPHLVSCCGAKFCEPCIGRVKAAGQPCPLCKQDFDTILDREELSKVWTVYDSWTTVCHSSSQVLNLKVRCSRHNDGCQWVGELRHVVPHEREECGWAVVECNYQCGAHLPRRLMDEHQRDECPQRSVESRLKRLEERHKREVSALRREIAEQKREIADVRDKMRAMKVSMIALERYVYSHMI